MSSWYNFFLSFQHVSFSLILWSVIPWIFIINPHSLLSPFYYFNIEMYVQYLYSVNITNCTLFNGYWGIFPRVKAAMAWNWPFTPSSWWGQKWMEVYFHILYIPSRHEQGQFYLFYQLHGNVKWGLWEVIKSKLDHCLDLSFAYKFFIILALNFRLLYSDGSEAVAFLYQITKFRQLFASFFVFLLSNFHRNVKFKQK